MLKVLKLLALLTIVAALVVISACASSAPPAEQKAAPKAAEPAKAAPKAAEPAKEAPKPAAQPAKEAPKPAAKAPIKIGVLASISGPASFVGLTARETTTLLQEKINASGGIGGANLEIVIYDDACDETKGVLATRKLIEEDKVLALIASTCSGVALAIAPVAEENKIPLVANSGTTKIVDPIKPWVFKAVPAEDQQLGPIVDYSVKKGLTKWGVLYDSAGLGVSGRQWIEANAPKKGIQLVAIESYGSTDTDMTAQLVRIRAAGAQAVVQHGMPPGPSIIAKNMKQLGMTIPLFGHTLGNNEYIRLAGDAANVAVGFAAKPLVVDDLPDSDPQKAPILAFYKDFKAKYNKEPDSWNIYAAEPLLVLAEAIKRAGPDRVKIRDTIENMKDFVGIHGKYNYSKTDHVGLGPENYVTAVVKDGKWRLLKD